MVGTNAGPPPPSGHSPNKLGERRIIVFPNLLGKCPKGFAIEGDRERWGPLVQAAFASIVFGFDAEPMAICLGFMASGTSRVSEMWSRP